MVTATRHASGLDRSEFRVGGYLPRCPEQTHAIEIFGFEIARRGNPNEFDRSFMARFGDVARIEARGRRMERIRSGVDTRPDHDRAARRTAPPATA